MQSFIVLPELIFPWIQRIYTPSMVDVVVPACRDEVNPKDKTKTLPPANVRYCRHKAGMQMWQQSLSVTNQGIHAWTTLGYANEGNA